MIGERCDFVYRFLGAINTARLYAGCLNTASERPPVMKLRPQLAEFISIVLRGIAIIFYLTVVIMRCHGLQWHQPHKLHLQFVAQDGSYIVGHRVRWCKIIFRFLHPCDIEELQCHSFRFGWRGRVLPVRQSVLHCFHVFYLIHKSSYVNSVPSHCWRGYPVPMHQNLFLFVRPSITLVICGCSGP